MASKEILSASSSSILSSRTILLAKVLGQERAAPIVKQLELARGSVPAALAAVGKEVPRDDVERAQLADHIATLTANDIDLTAALLTRASDARTVRDVVRSAGLADLTEHFAKNTKTPEQKSPTPTPPPTSSSSSTTTASPHQQAQAVRQRFFKAEPTAVLHRMVIDKEILAPSDHVRNGVAQFFANHGDFDIRGQSVLTELQQPDAFKGVPTEHQGPVADALKRLQTVQSLSNRPEAIPILQKANLTTAFQVSSIPKASFVRAMKGQLGENVAEQIHQHAMQVRARNDHALVSMLQTVRGTGIAAIDGTQNMEDRKKILSTKINAAISGGPPDPNAPPVIDLASLFGSLDYCECSDCCSVLSPAAYFVELLEFLRNDNLSSDTTTYPNSGLDGISNTVLEHLFARRPDLGCLELSCENTNTILPYVDLANEVMESFVVHRINYAEDTHNPKWAVIDVHNVEGETSSELLSEPQHTNYQAYCVLKDAVFPILNAPYHQALDETRIFLNYLGTSRYSLLTTFKPQYATNSSLSADQNQELKKQHYITLQRAAVAEFWSMTPVDYIAITGQSYWTKEFWEIVKNDPDITTSEYQTNIGRKQPWQYWGYGTNSDNAMQDTSSQETGLTFVEAQFLPRSGIAYTDLVNMLQTQYINPNYPAGRDLQILESIQFSYRYLQRLVNSKATDDCGKYSKLAKFIYHWKPWAHKHGVTKKNMPQDVTNVSWSELCCWIKNWWSAVGQLIVLESNDVPLLPIQGYVVGLQPYEALHTSQKFASLGSSLQKIGWLNQDGSMTNITDQSPLGSVLLDGTVVDASGSAPFITAKSNYTGLYIMDPSIDQLQNFRGWQVNQVLGVVGQDSQLVWPNFTTEQYTVMRYLPTTETCNIDHVQILHLDGSTLTDNEWDRMQIFIRLYNKLGWSINDTDQALAGLATRVAPETILTPPASVGVSMDGITDWSQTQDTPCTTCGEPQGSCSCGGGKTTLTWCADNCSSTGPEPPLQVDPLFLEQLVAVNSLLTMTGLSLTQLLTLWTDIPTLGNPSLYSTLFLPHTITAIDPVFEADANGNYLTDTTATIGAHVPVILAAFKLNTAGLNAVANLTDPLNLTTVSQIYRYVLLGQILSSQISQLPQIIALFGPAFTNATTTLAFVNMWNKMQNTGFSFAQLNYLILNINNPLRPVGPSLTSVLTTSKSIFDGLNNIDTQNPNYTAADESNMTAQVVTAKVSQIFDTLTTASIVAMLQGTTVYSTNAPSGLNITVPASLQAVLMYQDNPTAVPPRATLTVIGILTTDEETAALSLAPGNSDWAAALTRVAQQAENFFDAYLSGIFSDKTGAKATILAGDIPASTAPGATTTGTAPGKMLYFMQGFIVYLRSVLSQRLILADVSGPANLPTTDMATLVLSSIINIGGQTAMQILSNIQNAPSSSGSSWSGYLIPPSTASFTFYANGGFPTQPPPLVINGNSVVFTHQQQDPNDVWYTDPLPLTAGQLYTFQVSGQGIDNLQWLSPGSPLSAIPTSALLPDYSSSQVLQVFQSAYKIGLVINGFSLSVDEVSYFAANAADFASVNFNAMTIQAWSRLADYSILRNSMPAMPNNLLDLFKWAKSNPNPGDLVGFINSVTNWAEDDLTKLIAPAHFNLQDPSLYVNEIQMNVLNNAITAKNNIGIDVDLLFTWADPLSFLWKKARQIAQSIRNQVRSQYDVNTWEQVAQPLFNTLRGHQRDALIAFLLVQKPLQDWGVVDADSLFEFFLIDVQMGSCLQTSRIKQAISSVQLFVERCLMNLEQSQGVQSQQVDSSRWQGFMNGYSFWEADREVFLWPENWLDPSIRDDKSSFYLTLEAKILQNSFTMQTAQDAMKNYLFSADQVANLEAVGLVQDETSGTIHIFAKTKFTPWQFYYRRFNVDQTWTPWESVGVDIVTYDNTDPTTSKLIRSGSYLLPVVWNSRLLIFLPEFTQKQRISNGAWTTKQVTAQAISQTPPTSAGVVTPTPLPPINTFSFVPKVSGAQPYNTTVEIGVFSDSAVTSNSGASTTSWTSTSVGSFVFDGSQVSVLSTVGSSFTLNSGTFSNPDFMYEDQSSNPANPGTRYLYSYQDNGDPIVPVSPPPPPSPLSVFAQYPVITYSTPQQPIFQPSQSASPQNFYDQISHQLVAQASTSPDVSGIFAFFEDPNQVTDPGDAFGNTQPNPGWSADYDELKTPYALYHWEIGCYAPMTMMNKFLANQQFDEALTMASYVFDPFAQRSQPPLTGDLWRWPPFKNVLPEDALEQLFAQLQPNQIVLEGSPIQEWRDNPFEPFVVARSRRQAFMKWFAIQYINILIAYGDWYFMQNTLESIPLALQLYVRASHIYGPAAQQIPPRGKKQVQTYNSLLNSWDGFSNAVVQLELAFPYSNQIDQPLGKLYDDKLLANIYGFATTRYFCVPPNQQLLATRSLIDDRLYKIRHCMDINGNVEQLPLFEPPINPALLIDATAAGVSLDTVLNDIDAPMPNYRFNFLMQKALELAGDLKALGGQFLSNKEKIDSESLQVIRAQQDVTMSSLVMQLKQQALQDANLGVAALLQQRTAAVYRITHWLNMLGNSTDSIPDPSSDFQPLDDQIVAPASSDNPFKLNTYEVTETSKAADANSLNKTISDVETMAQTLHIIPNVDTKGLPWGIGIGLRFGPENFAQAASAVARAMKISADDLSYEGSNAGRQAGYLREMQDRIYQANQAGYEIKNLDAQIQTQTEKVTMATQEITNQQQAIENANQIQQYLQNKYTNVDLYTWMDNNIQTLYYQTYTIAYQMAQKAQTAFCFERGLDPSQATYISFGYWNPNRGGLLAGENLYLGLKQLEAAYQSDRGYDFEVTRHISLRQFSPLALFQLRENGYCQINLPEIFFDMDFPGHYMRQIKSVSLSIPCVVGPYTSISCTLRLLNSQYRVDPTASDSNSYLQLTNSVDSRFRTPSSLPISSIAVSQAQNDSGVFDLNFKDERYIPFEGGGVISSWSLELPSSFRQWDYSSMSDVIMHVRYTSKDGGDNLSSIASGAVTNYIKSMQNLSQDQGLFALFDLKSEFANEWAKAITPPSTPGAVPTLILNNLAQRLPAYTRGTDPSKILAVDVYLLLAPNPDWVSQATLIAADGTSLAFTKGPSLGQMAVWQNFGIGIPISNWQLQLSGTGTVNLTRGFVMVRYQLG
ncbi:hypothetical protein V8E51_008400 [Hyaloscypha variabilis]